MTSLDCGAGEVHDDGDNSSAPFALDAEQIVRIRFRAVRRHLPLVPDAEAIVAAAVPGARDRAAEIVRSARTGISALEAAMLHPFLYTPRGEPAQLLPPAAARAAFRAVSRHVSGDSAASLASRIDFARRAVGYVRAGREACAILVFPGVAAGKPLDPGADDELAALVRVAGGPESAFAISRALRTYRASPLHLHAVLEHDAVRVDLWGVPTMPVDAGERRAAIALLTHYARRVGAPYPSLSAARAA